MKNTLKKLFKTIFKIIYKLIIVAYILLIIFVLNYDYTYKGILKRSRLKILYSLEEIVENLIGKNIDKINDIQFLKENVKSDIIKIESRFCSKYMICDDIIYCVGKQKRSLTHNKFVFFIDKIIDKRVNYLKILLRSKTEFEIKYESKKYLYDNKMLRKIKK